MLRQGRTRRSQVDEVTRLAPQHRFRADLAIAIRNSQRDGLPLSLALLHLDGLHDIDRTYGRRNADALLGAAAASVRAINRQDQYTEAYRVGAYTFGLILRQTTVGEAGTVMTAVQQRIVRQASGLATVAGIAYREGPADSGTEPGADGERFLQAADAALTQARLLGRPFAAVRSGATAGPIVAAVPQQPTSTENDTTTSPAGAQSAR